MPDTIPDHEYDVFISYARADGRAVADLLYTELTQRGYEVWHDKRDVAPGQDFSGDIEHALERAEHMIVCLTPAVAEHEDSFVLREIMYAQGRKKPISVLVFPSFPRDHTPPAISHLEWVDFTDFDGGLAQLLARLDSETYVASAIYDPFRDYLNDLYKQLVAFLENDLYRQLVEFLDTTVFSFVEMHVNSTVTEVDDTTTFDTFADAVSHFGGRMLLFGQAGSGKTITLTAYAREAVTRRLADPSQPLPIMVPVHTWDPLEQPRIADWLEDVIGHEGIAAAIASGKALLMLDALDELGSDREDPNTEEHFDPRVRFIDALRRCAPQNQMLIASRIETNPRIVDAIPVNGIITLRALDENKLQAYLRDFPAMWSVLQEDKTLRSLVRTPVFLALFTFTYAGMDDKVRYLRSLRDDPQKLRMAIFEDYIQRTYESRAVPGSDMPYALRDLREELKIAAAYMYMQTWRIYAPMPASGLQDNQITQTILHPNLIAFAEDLDLLERDSQNGVTFISSILRDTFAHEKLLLYLQSDEPELRFGAARGLGLLGQRGAVEPLLAALSREQNQQILYAIRASLEALKPDYSLFISYRRRDWPVTFLIEETLREKIDASIFLDREIDEADFETSIQKHLRASSVFLLVITERTFEPGRIHLERDWVRREIREAMAHDKPIILVFVDGITMPDDEYLPRDIRSIVTRQGFPIYPNSFEQDIVKLADFITTISPINRKKRRSM
ncbi:MAG: TIR domain-containing protein [Anaerolineae bacterium]|nr:TIR domain-containing protein [Anaerolineae bacterium]